MTTVFPISRCIVRGLCAVGALGTVAVPAMAQAVNEDSAQELAKKGKCFRCHSVEKTKKAPSYVKIAAKYKGKPNGVDTLYKHLSGNATVKVEDADETHEPPPTDKPEEVRNLIRWILSRE